MKEILINLSRLTFHNWNEEREEWDKIINIVPKKINNYTSLEDIVKEAKEIKRQIINITKEEGFESIIYCYIGTDIDRSLMFEIYDAINHECPIAVKVVDINYDNNIKQYKFIKWRKHH